MISQIELGAGLIGLSPLPRNLEELEIVGAWRADLAVSLTQDDEFHRLAPDGLIQVLGADRLVFPIADYGVPTDRQTQAWPDIAACITACLERGERVLIHCKGGCGRTGMIVLRLMVEAGEDPDKALHRLRRSRPCAIETQAQLRWAQGCPV
ncbi:protein-tyrosine phosphatase family protein [Algirhabdus cladophorae]|uniref:protein-tyrosine phosphatase family protein n=1 Tax=Algirhabdus cladophorae TaxID=3377108 RepID=UPI003B849D12